MSAALRLLVVALAAVALLAPRGRDAHADGLDAFPPGAPPMPVCNAPREGVAACLGGVACLCRHERGGSLTGRPTGFRWDCGALRARCGGGGGDSPADLPGSAQTGPTMVPVFPQITLPPAPGDADGALSRGPPFPRVWR